MSRVCDPVARVSRSPGPLTHLASVGLTPTPSEESVCFIRARIGGGIISRLTLTRERFRGYPDRRATVSCLEMNSLVQLLARDPWMRLHPEDGKRPPLCRVMTFGKATSLPQLLANGIHRAA